MLQSLISDDAVEAFHRDGYVLLRELLSPVETRLLGEVARADRAMTQNATSRADGEGGAVRLLIENELHDDDIYTAIVRAAPLVDAMERLLGDEVYHYHHKMILKEARVGGAWAWHQDYGYWYNNGCLFPDMASCMVAVDRATKANGCLQVLRGSHCMGRVEHGKVGDQTGADPERVEAALARMELVHVELAPGDAILFHGNLLHRSDQNRSDDPRWAFICCYNTRHNDPYKESRHPRYSRMEKWPAERIVEVGRRHLERMGTQTTAR